MDIVIEGRIPWIDDPTRLQRIGEAYQDKYAWPVTVAGNAFNAAYGAPTAGHPLPGLQAHPNRRPCLRNGQQPRRTLH